MNRLSYILAPLYGILLLETQKPCFSRFLKMENFLPLRMLNSDAFSKLMFQHEVLRARHEIREQHLNTVVREVYENIGQVLSLVGMELGSLEQDNSSVSKDKVQHLGELVRHAIRDLRHLSGHLYSEPNGSKVDHLIDSLNKEIELSNPDDAKARIKMTGHPKNLEPGAGIILFRILNEIISRINKHGKLLSAAAVYKNETLAFTIQYESESVVSLNMPGGSKDESETELSIEERIQLIGGKLEISESALSQKQHELKIHFKNIFNE